MGERRDPYSLGVPVPAAKTAVPEPSASLISRQRLVSALDAGTCRPLTLVCAPAGYGKTALLTLWTCQAPGPVAWVSLDGDDNDPRRLWSALLRSLRAAGVPAEALWSLPPPNAGLMRPADLEGGEARTVPEQPVALVLDNMDELIGGAALRGLELLVHHQPRWLRLVMVSRCDPPLALHRPRIAGLLHEVRAAELQFTPAETLEVLGQYRLRLTARELSLLLDRTEGWPAGIRLAALSMQSAENPGAFVREFSGDDRSVADYLAEEVLSRRPAAEREFMLATSVCEQVSADLGDALTGRDDGAAVLDRLHRANALVTRMGSGSAWYRYHSLLKGYLYAELRRRHPAASTALHRRAADWFDARDLPVEAIRHAIAAPDLPRAAALLDLRGTALVMSGQGGTVRRLLRGLPASALESDPRLLLVAALARLDAGDAVGTGRYLSLSQALTDQPAPQQAAADPRLRALEAVVRLGYARLGGDLTTALADAERLSVQAPDRDGLSALALAERGAVRVQSGQLAQGRADLESALAIAAERHLDQLSVQCMSGLAAVAAAECRFDQAVCLGRAAADAAARHGWDRAALCAPAYVALALASYQRLETESAERFCRLAGQALRGPAGAALEFGVRMLAAFMAFERGERRRGLLDLRVAWEGTDHRRLMPELVAFGCLAEVEMALGVGERLWAAEALARASAQLDGRAETAVLAAALLRARGHRDAARRCLRPALDGTAAPVVATGLIEAWLLEARLSAELGEQPRAGRALHQALALAEPQGVLRPFLAAGPPARRLLVDSLPGLGSLEAFAAELLRLGRDASGPVSGEALTPREADLMRQLPSLHTLDEIAADLFISVNTLKTHLRSIYRKLAVGSRRQAVQAAREQGLL